MQALARSRISCPAVMSDHRVKWTASLAIWTDFGRWPAVIFIPGIQHGSHGIYGW